MTDRIRQTRYIRAAACAAAALLAWAYWPGLSGPFLFDDFANLDKLGAFGPMDDWRSFLFYLTSGSADPTGRPVAMLSFLLDAQQWPADPWPFKRTNLVLHLLNFALLGVLLTRLQQALARRMPGLRTSPWTPWTAAALWAAHPFFVSTTLYVVQREAMLPMTFAMLAMLAWDRAVGRFEADRPRSGWAWALLGVGGFTVLAGLSKANGFLVPLLAGLAHLWIYRPATASQARRATDRAAALCLGLPSLLLLGYLVHHGASLWSVQLAGRDWTIGERLLTQPRVLWDYVAHLVLPRAGGGGLFVEGFQASRGWTEPFSTLPAAFALLASVVAALAFRRRFPIASFAWLFFLAAHLMESSVVALELYFEHRNYLPAAFLGWPLAHLLLKPGAYLRYRAGAVALLLVALLVLTHQRASVWGNPALLTALTASHQDDSARAQVAAAWQRLQRGDAAGALDTVHQLQARHPQSVDVAFNAVSMECLANGALAPETRRQAIEATRLTGRWTFAMNMWLQDAAREPAIRQCNGLGLEGLELLADAAASNPLNQPPRRLREIMHAKGRIALAEGRPEVALEWFNAALELHPDPNYALVQAAALGDVGAQALGVEHLDAYARIPAPAASRIRDMPGLHRWLLRHCGYYDAEIAHLRRRLVADAARPRGNED